jgi:protein TonB
MIQKCTLLVSALGLLGLVTSKPILAQRAQLAKYEKGTLQNGQKVGIWEYYGATTTGEQVVVQRYDHDKHKLLSFRPVPYATYLTEVKPDQWRYVQADQPPMFIGGAEALAVYTAQLVYPQEAQERMLQGKVVVTFQIDTLGQVSNYRVTQRIGRACDEEALRVARTIPPTWVPARMGSRAVAVEYELPFTFRMTGR